MVDLFYIVDLKRFICKLLLFFFFLLVYTWLHVIKCRKLLDVDFVTQLFRVNRDPPEPDGRHLGLWTDVLLKALGFKYSGAWLELNLSSVNF